MKPTTRVLRQASAVWRTAFLIIGLLLACGPGRPRAAASDLAAKDEWVQRNFVAVTNPLPFSFTLAGQASEALLPVWTRMATDGTLDPHRTRHTITWSNATGLQVTCEITDYSDFPAVEWVVWFENHSVYDSAILENIQALDTVLEAASPGSFHLHTARGSYESPNDFEPLTTTLAPGGLTQSPISGRSSDGGNGVGNGRMPFFNLEHPGGNIGNILAIGWTGTWQARFLPIGDNGVQAISGMPVTHLRLHPGEKIRSPSVLLTFWSGAWAQGQNQFRRLLLEHYSPKPGGQPVTPPISSSVHGTYGFGDTSEQNIKDFINKTADNNLPVSHIWIDAGWYDSGEHAGNWDWPGTWQADPVRYPHGLKPVIDQAHTRGFKFVLWFEPERVSQGSWLDLNHPEWVLKAGAEAPNRYLLNLGNPSALNWAKTNFSSMIQELGLDVYRQDYNFNATPAIWQSNDTPDRQGMTEIRHIMGLYDYWDFLLEQNPDLIIDNCAGGGRRIDIETLRRSIVLWRSDYCWVSDPEQCINYGLSSWIPITGRGTISTNPYDFRSGLGSFLTLAYNANDPSTWVPARALLSKHLPFRHLFTGDFYPLSPYSQAGNAWMAWQYHRPELDEGIVQVFARSGTPIPALQFKLQGLDPAKTYAVQDLDKGALGPLPGSDLIERGLDVQLAPGQSAMFYYKASPVTLSAASSRQAGVKPLTVEFTAFGSSTTGAPLTYSWSFGDGGSSAEQNPSHTYTNGGRYLAEVTGDDGRGNVGKVRLPITVIAASRKMKVSFPGYNQTEALTNFPALVVFGSNLTANGFSYDQAASARGWDLVFLDCNETLELNHEIESWDPNSNSYVWVQLPRLSTNTFIWAYWGDTNRAGAPAAYTTNGAVWANGFVSVWHLSESNGYAFDSTANRTPGTIDTSFGACARNVPAKVGAGYTFDGGYLSASGAVLPGGSNPRTVSAWFKKSASATPSPGKEILGYGNNTPGQRFALWISGNGSATALGVENCGAARSFPWIWDGQWHHLAALLPAGTSDLSGVKLYYDGTERTSATGQGPIATAQDELSFASIPAYHNSDRTYDFDGSLDEVRISDVARSTNWVWAEWLTAASNTLFTSYGPVLDNQMDAYGVPNWWKLQYFGSVTGPGTGALDDWDQDGVWNSHEYQAGTIPTNAASLLALKVGSAGLGPGADLLLQWPGVAGKTYAVETCTNLSSGDSWRPVTLNIRGTGSFNTWTGQVSGQESEFFRVRLQ